jgi:hypothetical protein
MDEKKKARFRGGIGPFLLLIMSVSENPLILRKLSLGGYGTKGQWTKVTGVTREQGTEKADRYNSTRWTEKITAIAEAGPAE